MQRQQAYKVSSQPAGKCVIREGMARAPDLVQRRVEAGGRIPAIGGLRHRAHPPQLQHTRHVTGSMHSEGIAGHALPASPGLC